MAASASAIDCTTAPAIVAGAIAPARVKGVTITGWPRRAKRMAPSSIGQSCLSGLEELMLVKSRGALSNSAWQARGDAGHLDHVLDALGAEAVGVHHLVGQRQLLVEAVEVADRGVDVDRLDRVAAGEVDAVEVLRQPDEVAEVLDVADAAAAVEVHGVRRRGDVAEEHVPAADGHPARGVARGHVELRRRLATCSMTKPRSSRTVGDPGVTGQPAAARYRAPRR